MTIENRFLTRRNAKRPLCRNERTALGWLRSAGQYGALPYLCAILISAGTAGAHAGVHDQPIPSHGLSAPEIEAWSDAIVRSYMNDYDIPGLTVAISQDGRIVYAKGFGYRDISSGDPASYLPMQRWTRSRLGSTSKVLATIGAMKLMEEQPDDFSLATKVYGQNGILGGSHWKDDQKQGSRRWLPIVDMAIGENKRVTTWYVDGKYTIGNSVELDRYKVETDYTVPAGQDYDTIIKYRKDNRPSLDIKAEN
jgi:hypothetical protein